MTHASDCHCCSTAASSVQQTLTEMDFERGIWSAAINNELSRVDQLLTRGICINSVDNYGYTALHYACSSGHLDIVRLLLNSGADVNCQTRSGLATPLHRAAYRGHTEIVKLLLKFGAKVELTDDGGLTALHKATEMSRTDVTALLVQHSSHGLEKNSLKEKSSCNLVIK